MPCSPRTTPQGMPARRMPDAEVTAPDRIPNADANGADTPGVHWLGWDGRLLRWCVSSAIPLLAELRIDGVRFDAFAVEPSASGQEFTCAFGFSPTGCAELEFTVAQTGALHALAAWRVLFGSRAPDDRDQWREAPPRLLSPLAGTPRLPLRAWAQLPQVAVIVPIFNAADSVRRCLAALARFTPRNVRVILVDDASSDLAIAGLLAHFAQRGQVEIARHASNLGYTHAVNAGMQLAGEADVILLNSDTEVGPRWYESLRLAAYSDATIGTVTAVSDNAGAFSVPELEQFCPIPERWDLPTAQRALLQQAGLCFPELPTGNGFCLFIKRDLIARIGVMDAEAFPFGYGEENDFCQRALRAGYRNVIAGQVLVRHERSASFGDARRAALGAQGMAVLRQRYPNYEADVGATLYSFERRVLDYRVRRTYADSDGRYAHALPRARLLIAVGAQETPNAVECWPELEVFVLRHVGRLRLQRIAAHGAEVIEAEEADGPTQQDPACCIGQWLLVFAIEYVQIWAADDWGKALLDAAFRLGIPVLPGAREPSGT